MTLFFKLYLPLARSIFRSVNQMMLFFLIIIGLTLNVSGQNKQIQFAVDHAQFRLQQNFVYLEIYYSIDRNSLTLKRVTEGLEALANIKTYIKSADASMLVDSLTIQDLVKTKDEISPSQKFAEISCLQIREGEYLLHSTATDLNSNSVSVYSDSLYLTAFSDDSLSLSEIELATSINPQSEIVNKFDKNGLHVIPNANRTYGSGLPKLNFYAEAYNLIIEGEAQRSTYHLTYFILDQQGTTVTEITGRPKPKPGRSTVIHGSLDIGDLASGVYQLEIQITDDFSGRSAQSMKNFFVYKAEGLLKITPLTLETKLQSGQDEFMAMDENALNNYFETLKYIAAKDELKVFKKLDITGKRNFLVQFWAQRDPDPQTEINEKKQEYLQLLEYANQEFSTNMKSGWATDRGRVLLIYGKPQQMDRFPATSDSKAYQVWYYYELEGGVEFIFVDRFGMGDFQLVHSTKRNEIQDSEWKTHYVLE